MNGEQELPGIAENAGSACVKKLADGPFLGRVGCKNRACLTELLRIYSERGKTLEWCAQKSVLDRKPETLKAYCREAKIAFPDYTPPSMREQGAA